MTKVKRAKRTRVPQTSEAATLTPNETRRITRFGLNHTYRLLRSGEMPAIKVGARFFVPRSALLKWLESCGKSAA